MKAGGSKLPKSRDSSSVAANTTSGAPASDYSLVGKDIIGGLTRMEAKKISTMFLPPGLVEIFQETYNIKPKGRSELLESKIIAFLDFLDQAIKRPNFDSDDESSRRFSVYLNEKTRARLKEWSKTICFSKAELGRMALIFDILSVVKSGGSSYSITEI